MLTARDVGKIVFWDNGYSDSSYKYFLLKKFKKIVLFFQKKYRKNGLFFSSTSVYNPLQNYLYTNGNYKLLLVI